MTARSVRGKAQRRAGSFAVAQAHSYRNVRVNGAQDVVRDYQPCSLLGALERGVTCSDRTPVLLKSLGGSDPRPSKICWNRSSCIEGERRLKLG